MLLKTLKLERLRMTDPNNFEPIKTAMCNIHINDNVFKYAIYNECSFSCFIMISHKTRHNLSGLNFVVLNVATIKISLKVQ